MEMNIQLLAVLRNAGMRVQHIYADGKLHRVPAGNDTHGKKSCWYVAYVDSVPTVTYGNWREGNQAQTWCALTPSTITAQERKLLKLRMAEVQRQREADDIQRHAEAALKAKELWNASTVTDYHPYAIRKHIAPIGLRVGNWPQRKRENALLAPIHDVASGELINLQAIFDTPLHTGSNKDFLFGARKKGGAFLINCVHGSDYCSLMGVTEGIATGITIHTAKAIPVACAMDCGNLECVAIALRKKYPMALLCIYGDDDHSTAGNPGRTKANEAAIMVSGKVAFPSFTEEEKKQKLKDWNDWAIVRKVSV